MGSMRGELGILARSALEGGLKRPPTSTVSGGSAEEAAFDRARRIPPRASDPIHRNHRRLRRLLVDSV